MFELKCDVKGCEEREALPLGMMGGLPPGWRHISYIESHMRGAGQDQHATAKIKAAAVKLAGKEMGEALGSYLEALPSTVTMPIHTAHQQKHVCPNHQLVEFED